MEKLEHHVSETWPARADQRVPKLWHLYEDGRFLQGVAMLSQSSMSLPHSNSGLMNKASGSSSAIYSGSDKAQLTGCCDPRVRGSRLTLVGLNTVIVRNVSAGQLFTKPLFWMVGCQNGEL